jgi:RNA polymerase sigma-70 factor (ECF subfamily)
MGVGVDEVEFGALAERHRRELRVHCYRMLGSYDEAEDLVQETFLRAWRRRDGFEGRSTFRAWLYRIATNACLDFLDRHPRAPKPYATPPAFGPEDAARPDEVPWLQPYPDDQLPDEQVIARETIELAFLVAIQHLPPRQRAALILRDVLGWPAPQTAEVLGTSVAGVKSALQRARPVLRERLPEQRSEWPATVDPTEAERELLRRYLDAMDARDASALADLLADDLRVTMPPHSIWFAGAAGFASGIIAQLDPASPGYIGDWRVRYARANRCPVVANYLRTPGDTVHRAQVLNVLRISDGRIAAITAFVPDQFARFDLPPTA